MLPDLLYFLISISFQFVYVSLVMEEAAQVLEIETLIPTLLQDTDVVDGSRLKRVVLIGDHNQVSAHAPIPSLMNISLTGP